MTSIEKRRHTRVDSFNLSYVCTDENGRITNEGMGRTLNVSESGILLETHFPLDLSHSISLTVAMEEDLVDFRGKIVHYRKGNDDIFETGVEFVEISPADLQLLRRYVVFFNKHQAEFCLT